MENVRKYVVFFDIDNTLSGTNSANALILTAYRKGLLRISDIITFIFILALFKLGLRKPESLIRAVGKKVKGMSNSDFTRLGEEAFDTYLREAIFDKGKEAIEYHRKSNAYTVILSSTVEDISVPLAKYLGIDAIICTRMESIDGHLTGKPAGKYCYGEEKKIKLVEFCNSNSFSKEDAYYYADSISDIEALKAVGNPICVNPDRRLRRSASNEYWKIVHWKQKK